jgi:DNA-binding GntR family transcriptional regulator
VGVPADGALAVVASREGGTAHLLGAFDVPPTVESRVFDRLREAVLDGTLAPGARLRIAALSGELGVSTLPVRSALARLAAEGLVVQAPRRGAVVAPLEYEELEEIQAVRFGIEGLAARLGVAALDADLRALMSSRMQELVGVASTGDLAAFLRAEWLFRDTCLAASGRQRLLVLVADYRNRVQRYLRVAFSTADGLEDSIGHQRAFLAACERGDADEAERTTRAALTWTLRAVRPYFAGGDTAGAPVPRAPHKRAAASSTPHRS